MANPKNSDLGILLVDLNDIEISYVYLVTEQFVVNPSDKEPYPTRRRFPGF